MIIIYRCAKYIEQFTNVKYKYVFVSVGKCTIEYSTLNVLVVFFKSSRDGHKYMTIYLK